MAAITPIRTLFQPKLCFLGAPGSGKGSYGKILARHWGIPIVSVSNVIQQQQRQRQRTNNSGDENANHSAAMSSGKLVDDHVVSQSLIDHLTKEQKNDGAPIGSNKGYILDGFPRTIQQVILMEETWPAAFQMDAAVHLNVPANVCERKLLGRRICALCGNHYNVNGVLSGGFDLPPKLPRPGECHHHPNSGGGGGGGSMSAPPLPQHHQLADRVPCDATAPHWKRRDDDQQDIIHHRLEVYTQHTEPILDHFKQRRSLFQFVPYKGFDDMPKFQSGLEDWLVENFPNTVSGS